MNGHRLRWRLRLLATATGCLLVTSFSSPVPQNPKPESVVEAAARGLVGKVMPLRHLQTGSTVKYDESGKLEGAGPAGEWTLHSQLQITKVELKKETLIFRGKRVGLIFDNGAAQPRRALIGSEAEIQIAIRKSEPFDLDKEFLKAFLASTESWPENMPAHWERFVICGSSKTCPQVERAGVAAAGTNVTPRVMKQPEYNDLARKERLTGQLGLSIIVEPNGTVSNIQVIKPLGLGLEKQAVETMQNWRFEPATRDLKPTATYADILLNFSLK